MIRFVLGDACRPAGQLEGVLAAISVLRGQFDVAMSGYNGGQPGDTEAPFVKGTSLQPKRRNHRIDELEEPLWQPFSSRRDLRAEISRILDDRNRQWNSDL